MDRLVDISSRLQATEHFMDEVWANKAMEATWREQSPSCSQPITRGSKDRTHRQHTSDELQQAAMSAMVNISDALRVKVAKWMRGAPIIDLVTLDKDSDLGEETIPVPNKKALKSGHVRVADSSVLHKVMWPYEVVYTAMGKTAEYK